ncbi:MAG: HPF/RaiA family ribosome-associated protein [Phycisphaeraceae bacterium]|nr:MAG: HPF/RaiA family ribosome-associated protein [Phycisphaeraceae bacterium]
MLRFVHDRVASSLHRAASRVERVRVNLRDENGAKKGPADKVCVMEARVRGAARGVVVARERHSDFYSAIQGAARRLSRALTRALERAGPRHA